MKKLNHIIHKFKCPIKKSQKKRIELKSDTYKKIKLRNKQIIRNSGNLFFIQPKTHQSVSKLQYYGQNKSYFELQPITETMEKKKNSCNIPNLNNKSKCLKNILRKS